MSGSVGSKPKSEVMSLGEVEVRRDEFCSEPDDAEGDAAAKSMVVVREQERLSAVLLVVKKKAEFPRPTQNQATFEARGSGSNADSRKGAPQIVSPSGFWRLRGYSLLCLLHAVEVGLKLG